MAAFKGVGKAEVSDQMVKMGVEDFEQVHGRLPDDEPVIESDGGVGQAHFLEPCVIEKVLEMASVFGRVNDDAVFRKVPEFVQLLRVERDIPEQEIPDHRGNQT